MTFACMSVGEMPSCEPFDWTIVPSMLIFIMLTVWLGWKLAIEYNKIK